MRVAAHVGIPLMDRPKRQTSTATPAKPGGLSLTLAQPNLSFLIFEGAHNHRMLYDQVRASGTTLFGLVRDPLRLRVSRVDGYAEMGCFHDLIAVQVAPTISAPTYIDPRKFGRQLAGG